MLPQTVAFIATAAAIYSLGHGLRTFTAVPRSTQRGTPSSVPAQTSNCCNPTEDSGLSWPVCVVDIGRSYSQRGVVVSVPGASQSPRRCCYTAVTSNCCNPTEDRRLSGPVCVVDIGRSYSQRGVVVSVPGASQSPWRCYYATAGHAVVGAGAVYGASRLHGRRYPRQTTAAASLLRSRLLFLAPTQPRTQPGQYERISCCCKLHTHTHTRLTALCPGLPG